MKTVLMVSSDASDFTIFRREMILEIAKQYNVILAAPNQLDSNTFAGEFGVDNIRYQCVSFGRASISPLADAAFLCRMLKFLIASKPDCVFLFGIKPVVFGGISAGLYKVFNRQAIVASMITGLGFMFLGGRVRSGVAQFLYRIGLMSNSVIFFQNQDDIDLFVKNRICRPQLITRIPGSGVNIDAYAPSPFPDRITFLFLGRYLYDKGVREWFGALSILRSKGCDFDACMVGWADDNPSSASPEYIREQVERLGINNIGRVKDVRPCIQGSSILVLPSYREGISKSTLEAMAMGRPVITTNAPGCRETIVHDESGLLVEVKSDERLADAMEYFLNKPDEIVRMGANARRRAEQVFDVKIVNGIIVKALSSALSQR